MSQISTATMFTLSEYPSRVFQDDFSPAKGNALQACIASLFHQELQNVPNFIALECGYIDGIQNYLKPHGYVAVKKKICDILEQDQGRLGILRGKSPRGSFGHVVVAKIDSTTSFQMVHDPHPDATFLDREEAYGWVMVFEKATSPY